MTLTCILAYLCFGLVRFIYQWVVPSSHFFQIWVQLASEAQLFENASGLLDFIDPID